MFKVPTSRIKNGFVQNVHRNVEQHFQERKLAGIFENDWVY